MGIIPTVNENDTLTVLEDLRERFLATVQSECRIAQELDQPVLLLVFGHGVFLLPLLSLTLHAV
jgi:hypothetical protein